jgi:hypothetical protein
MSTLLYPAYALAYVVLLAWGALLLARHRHASTAIVLLVVVGVFWDNLVLTLGGILGAGDLLLVLSWPRFILHQLVLPWLVYAAWSMADQAGHGWASRRWARPMAIGLALALMAAGAATRLLGVTLEPEVLDGVVRYVAVGIKGPPLVSIVSIGFVGIAGVRFWRHGWPWITVAAIGVAIGEGFPDEGVRRVVGSALEVVFLAVLLETQRRLDSGRLRAPDRALPV